MIYYIMARDCCAAGVQGCCAGWCCMRVDSWAALSLVPGAWSVSCADGRSFGLIVGVICFFVSLGIARRSFLRVTQLPQNFICCLPEIQCNAYTQRCLIVVSYNRHDYRRVRTRTFAACALDTRASAVRYWWCMHVASYIQVDSTLCSRAP